MISALKIQNESKEHSKSFHDPDIQLSTRKLIYKKMTIKTDRRRSEINRRMKKWKYLDLVQWLKRAITFGCIRHFLFNCANVFHYFGIFRANSWRYFFVFSQQCSRDCWSHSFIAPHSTHSLYRCEFSISAESISFTLVGECWELGNLICFIYLFFSKIFLSALHVNTWIVSVQKLLLLLLLWKWKLIWGEWH